MRKMLQSIEQGAPDPAPRAAARARPYYRRTRLAGSILEYPQADMLNDVNTIRHSTICIIRQQSLKAHPASPHHSRPYSWGISPGELDHLTESEQVFEHDGCVLCVDWEKINGFLFSSAVFLNTLFRFPRQLARDSQRIDKWPRWLRDFRWFLSNSRLVEYLNVHLR
jgi:hypothetical protein